MTDTVVGPAGADAAFGAGVDDEAIDGDGSGSDAALDDDDDELGVVED